MQFLIWANRTWTRAEMHWDVIIPILFGIGLVLWLVLVYARGKFRLLPSFAIARVTVLDSIMRLEVIFLLIIGILLVGVFGFNLFSPQTRNLLIKSTIVQGRFTDITGGTNMELTQLEKEKSLCDLLVQAALLMAEFFVAIIGFVLSMFLLPGEINRGVILSILPKPLTRGEYVFGKFLGTWMIVTGCFFVLALELLGIQAIFYSSRGLSAINWHLLKAMALFPFKYATLVLVIMGLTLRFPEAVAGIVGIGIFIGGHFAEKIYDLSRDFADSPIFVYAFKFAYYILPHLTEAFSVNILDKNADALISWPTVFGWLWQIMVYNCLLLWLLTWLFKRRSL
ncbi:MAG: ABC transporter permease subunit [bacterium]